MAGGLMPNHTEELPLHELSRQQSLALAFEAAKRLGWTIRYIVDNGLIADTHQHESGLNAVVTVSIANNIARISSTSTATELAYSNIDRDNTEAFIAAFNALKSSLTAEAMAATYEALQPALVPALKDALPRPTQKWPGFWSIFKPAKDYFITPILIDLNLIIFIIMAIAGMNILEPDGQRMISWGANFKPLTLAGQPWRLITNCFLHFGVVHLLMNMYALLFIGLLLEPHLGKLRFAAAYLLTGIAASITSLWWHDLSISAGASGAIFGMYGVFLALLTTSLIERRQRRVQLGSIGIFVVYNLAAGVTGNIDNAAHIGGLVSGLLIGYAFIPSLRAPAARRLKLATVGLVTLLMLSASFTVYRMLPNDQGTYEATMKEVAAGETAALEVFRKPAGTAEDSIIRSIRQQGIPAWNKNIVLLTRLEKLKLPAHIRERTRKLKAYSALRAQSYALIARQMEEHTYVYQAEIDRCNREIDVLIRDLGGGPINAGKR